jgi:biotin carboxyl carrier protein
MSDNDVSASKSSVVNTIPPSNSGTDRQPMPEDNFIPTPPWEYWRLFRLKVIQCLGFLVVCLGIAFAWRQMAQPLSFPGEVEVIQAQVIATEAGVLTNLWIASYQQVKVGDPIAEVNIADSRVMNTRIEAMRLTLESLALAADSTTGSNNPAFRDAIRREQDKIQALENTPSRLLSPMNGTVTAIYRHPGEHVLPGQIIATITSQDAQRIVGFISPTFPIPPKAGMKVQVCAKSGNKKPASATIVAVGPQLEPVTNILVCSASARLAVTQPLGRPVSISLPTGLHLLPGEPLDIKLLP